MGEMTGARERATNSRARRSLRAALKALLALGLFLLLDVLGVLVVGTIQLRRVESSLGSAITELRRDDVNAAERAATRASTAADSALGLTQHPGFRLLRALPPLERDMEAFSSLAQAAELASSAADLSIGSLIEIGAADQGVAGSVYNDGLVDLEAVEALAGTIRAADVNLERARAELEHVSAFLSPLDEALSRSRQRLDSMAEALDRAEQVADVLPGFLGADGPRRYLLAFQSPSEARGGGGLIGVYGLLSATRGDVSLDHVGPVEELGPIVDPPASAPTGFTHLYGPMSALRDWRQANVSPDFVATSRVLLNMYERVRSRRLDGVIALDPLALGELTRATGPLRAEGWGKAISRDNARRLLLFRIYKHFVHQEARQNAYLRDLVSTAWNRIRSGGINAAGLITGLARSTSKLHLKFYSEVPAEQTVLVDLGVAGDPSAVEEPMQLVFNNNNSGNKIDFFLHRHQRIEVSLDENGGASIRTSVELTNEIPKRGLRAIARSGVESGLELGENRMSLHFMLPRGARHRRMTVDGRSIDSYSGRDADHPVEWGLVTVDPNEEVVVTLDYEVPGLVGTGDPGLMRFTLWPQATVRPDSYALSVTAPPGHVLLGRGRQRGPVVTSHGRLKEPISVSLRVVEG